MKVEGGTPSKVTFESVALLEAKLCKSCYRVHRQKFTPAATSTDTT